MIEINTRNTEIAGTEPVNSFDYFMEQFADIRILRYQVPGFDKLRLQEKTLLYYLSEAAICGRDIIFDQNGKYNLSIRKILEMILLSYSGDRNNINFGLFLTYVKRVWFANGVYHHYSSDKFKPGFSQEYFFELLANSNPELLPWNNIVVIDTVLNEIMPVIFDPDFMPRKNSKDPGKDMLVNSAMNFYENVTEKEAVAFYEGKKKSVSVPVSWGMNSKLVKDEKGIRELAWKSGGLYSKPIEKIIFWLNKAMEVSCNETQRQSIGKLIEFYETGEAAKFDDYSILWVKDVESTVDFVNGFIETYEDPLSIKATWESVVNFRDEEATHRTRLISERAQWFEDNSPVDERFKKKSVKGVSAKVITVVQLGGDCYPATPIGINLPNPDWIRQEYGSKSVSLENISYAYDQASLHSGFLEEFCFSSIEVQRIREYGFVSGNLHTDLHECLGHGSGQLLPGVSAEALMNYHAPLEEARADLFALYYMMDPIILELKLLPNIEAAYAEYTSYIQNGLITQLTRIEPGKDVEQAHMRNRKMIAEWCYEKGLKNNIIEITIREGKSYVHINDFLKLRTLFADLLAEVQRIKSEGDYEAGKKLIENYGVKIDKQLHAEVLERYKKLKLAPFTGFVNPILNPVIQEDHIRDILLDYSQGYEEQMLYYSKNYSYLKP